MSINWLGGLVLEQVTAHDMILDIGCGMLGPFGGKPIGPWHVGIEAFDPYIAELKREMVLVHGMAPEGLSVFEDKSFDVVLALDVIEHMEKHPAFETIKHAERIARRIVMLCTPEGFVKQTGCEAWGMEHNELQEHKCGFDFNELQRFGYQVTRKPNVASQESNITALFAKKFL